jgi:WD40 repeat protein
VLALMRVVVLALSLSWVSTNPALGSNDVEKSPMPVATQVASFQNGKEVAVLSFSPDGQYLAVSPTQDLKVNIWAWMKPHLMRTLVYPRPANLLDSRNGLKFSPDGKVLAFGHTSEAVVVELYDVTTGTVIHRIADPAFGGVNSNVAFTPDGKYMLRTYDSANPGVKGQIVMHRTDTWESVWSLNVLPLYPRTLSMSKDGKRAAVGGITLGAGSEDTGRILIVDLATHEIVRTIDNVFPPKAPVTMVSWHPNSVLLAAGTTGSSIDGLPPPPEPVKIVDTTTGRVVVSESAPPTRIGGLNYSSNGRYLVENGDSWMTVKIWDGEHRTLLQEIPVHPPESFAVTVSDDSRYLAVSVRDRVTVWQLQ